MKRALLGFLGAMAVVVASALVAPATAAAADTAYNVRTQWLTDEPNRDMPWSRVWREIDLVEGDYRWFPYVAPAAIALDPNGPCRGQTISLEADRYIMEDIIYPMDGYYAHYVRLTPTYPLWPEVRFRCDWRVEFTNNYTWGSALDPQF